MRPQATIDDLANTLEGLRSSLYIFADKRFTLSPETADDRLQDTYVKLHRRIQHGTSPTYLDTLGQLIVVTFKHLCIDHYRKPTLASFSLDQVMAHPPATTPLPLELLMQQETLAAVNAAIALLPYHLSQTLQAALDEQPHTTIAETEQVHQKTISTRIFRAKALLRSRLEPLLSSI